MCGGISTGDLRITSVKLPSGKKKVIKSMGGGRQGPLGATGNSASNPPIFFLVLERVFHAMFHMPAYHWYHRRGASRLTVGGVTGQKEAPTAEGTVRAMGRVVDLGCVVYIPLRNLQFHCTVGIAIRQ